MASFKPVQFKSKLQHSARPGGNGRILKPLYDPARPNALVLYAPLPNAQGSIHVVLDPRLVKFLRPHQREGVSFMYDCVSGKTGNTGCILADEMYVLC